MHEIVIGDEKWVYYENPKRQKAWVLPGKPGPSTPKCDIHAQKVMMCFWWDQEGMVYHKLLKPNETIIAVRYKQKLIKLNQALEKSGQRTPAVITN